MEKLSVGDIWLIGTQLARRLQVSKTGLYRAAESGELRTWSTACGRLATTLQEAERWLQLPPSRLPQYAAEPSVIISGLAFPPSVNHYWRHVNSRTMISRTGRAYRQQVLHDVQQLQLQAITGPIRLEAIVTRPDRRRRDVDNLLKSLLDALDHADVYDDDSQIHDLRIGWKCDENQQPVIVAGGECEVRIWRILKWQSREV